MQIKKLLLTSGFLVLALSFVTNANSQNYKEGQVISVGGGQFLKVMKCKGEGASQECEIKHYINSKQVGSSFWLTAASIAVQQKTYLSKSVAAKPKAATVEKVQVKNKAAVPQNSADAKRLAKLETSLNQADMLAIAKAAAEQMQTTQVVVEEMREEVQPKKVKKEFVSHNPYLLKQYKAGDATAKQTPEPGKE